VGSGRDLTILAASAKGRVEIIEQPLFVDGPPSHDEVFIGFNDAF
jgi:hypothetical protein